MNFNELNLSPALEAAVIKAGFTNATKVQEQCIPIIHEHRDLIGQSQTGSGKTAAFALPIIQACLNNPQQGISALIVCPTRELALQISQHIRMFTMAIENVSTVTVYGGESIDRQIRQLKKSANIVVGTPGRLLDHISRKTIRLNSITHVVLDEADEMLNMGFIDDIEKILSKITTDFQTSLFSATMPKAIVELSKKFLKSPKYVTIQPEYSQSKNIRQIAYEIDNDHKNELLFQLLSIYQPSQAMIFCNTKKMVDDLTLQLQKMDVACVSLHGDMRQESRTHIMKQFKDKKASLLIATDVAARGIDVESLDLVVNYDLPQQDEFYIHRIGRTGRAGLHGIAITFLNRKQKRYFQNILSTYDLEAEIKDVPTESDIQEMMIHQIKSKIEAVTEISSETHDVVQQLLESYTQDELLLLLLENHVRSNKRTPIKQNKQRTQNTQFVKYQINMGSKHGLKAKQLVNNLSTLCGVHDKAIGDIRISKSNTIVQIKPSITLKQLSSISNMNKKLNLKIALIN